jgi:hypothetical protein
LTLHFELRRGFRERVITGAARGVALGLDGAEVGIPWPTPLNPWGLSTTSLLLPVTYYDN